MTNNVIGTGSLSGWTEADFFHELSVLRGVVCSSQTSSDERERAIESALSLAVMCGDSEFSETHILRITHEMQLRHNMLNRFGA